MPRSRRERAGSEKDRERDKEKDRDKDRASENAEGGEAQVKGDAPERLTPQEWWSQEYREVRDAEMSEVVVSSIANPVLEILFKIRVDKELVPFTMDYLGAILKTNTMWRGFQRDKGEIEPERNPTWVADDPPRHLMCDNWSYGAHLRRTMTAQDIEREAAEAAAKEAAAKELGNEQLEEEEKAKQQAISGCVGQGWRIQQMRKKQKQLPTGRNVREDGGEISGTSHPEATGGDAFQTAEAAASGKVNANTSTQTQTGTSEGSASAQVKSGRDEESSAGQPHRLQLIKPCQTAMPKPDGIETTEFAQPLPSRRHHALSPLGVAAAVPQLPPEDDGDVLKNLGVGYNQSEFLSKHGYSNIFRASGPSVPQQPLPRVTRKLSLNFRSRERMVVGSVETGPPHAPLNQPSPRQQLGKRTKTSQNEGARYHGYSAFQAIASTSI